jgi:hypothetical protein
LLLERFVDASEGKLVEKPPEIKDIFDIETERKVDKLASYNSYLFQAPFFL